MSMLAALKFVQGAVAKKDFVSALTHFKIENRFIKSFNGNLSLCAPIDLDINTSPNALEFIKAVQSCKDDTTRITLTNNNRLKITSGKFTAFVNCLTEEFPEVSPEGAVLPPPLDLVPTLKLLFPFISEDASRPWSRGMLFAGNVIRATNNIVVVEKWVSECFPYIVNVPKTAVAELIKIGKQPVSMQLTDSSVTFHYDTGAWVRTNTLDTAWPDIEGKVFGSCVTTGEVLLTRELFEELETLLPFLDEQGKLFFFDGAVSTTADGATGAYIETPQHFTPAIFGAKYFISLQTVAHRIFMGNAPKPCLFFNEDGTLRGAIVGIRTDA